MSDFFNSESEFSRNLPIKDVQEIKSSKQLATVLGFTLDKSGSDGRLKIYERRFDFGGNEAVMLMAFDTVYNNPTEGEKPYQRERIKFSVRLGDRTAWTKPFPDEEVKKIFSELGLELERDVVKKELLKTGGYQRLRDFLDKEMQVGGRVNKILKDLIAEMIGEQTEGMQLIKEELIPEMQNRFPSFSEVLDDYTESKKIYFLDKRRRVGKPVRVIQFTIEPKQATSRPLYLLIETGRLKLPEGQVDKNSLYSYDRWYTLAPPDEMQDIKNPKNWWSIFEHKDITPALIELEIHLGRSRN